MAHRNLDAGELQAHMTRTYFSLRMGMGVIAAALPWLLWAGGRLIDGETLRCSMSAYYYSPSMRNTFVGGLVAIGAFLYLYKGFSRGENWALNVAGVLAVAIAMVPTAPGCESAPAGFSLHGTFAVLFFASIAYVCIFRASDTLTLIRDPRTASRLRGAYRLLGTGMIVIPLGAAALSFLLAPSSHNGSVVFFVEAGAVTLFAAYWLLKSAEMRATNAEMLVLERKVKQSSPSTTPSAPTRRGVVQVAE